MGTEVTSSLPLVKGGENEDELTGKCTSKGSFCLISETKLFIVVSECLSDNLHTETPDYVLEIQIPLPTPHKMH